MNWIVVSFLMLCSSVALYLFVRKSNQLQTPQQLNNLAMFLIPAIVYAVMVFGAHLDFTLTPTAYLLIFVQGIFFSYLGNVFSLKGIQQAPNPGYSLIISKSYVVFTTIASIFLFDAALTVQSTIAIVLIIAFSALIMMNKTTVEKKENASSLWLLYTLGAFFCWGMLALSSKYLLNMGVPILIRLLYTMVIVTFLIFGEIFFKKIRFAALSKEQMGILLAIGVLGAVFNYWMQLGFLLAPNVGYINAVNAASISLLTIFSALLFKDEMSLRKIIGVFGVTVGLLLLLL